jgi:hypothetical protein
VEVDEKGEVDSCYLTTLSVPQAVASNYRMINGR